MKINWKKILVVLLSVCSLVGAFFLGFFARGLSYQGVQRALFNILDKYYSEYLYSEDDVIDIISDALFDKYSTFYTKEEYDKKKQEALGDRVGLGISFLSPSLKIYSVILNSPAFNSGVRSGGELKSATYNGETTSFSTFEEFSSYVDNISNGIDVTYDILYGETLKSYTIKKAEYNQSYVIYANSEGSYYYTDKSGTFALELYDDSFKVNGNVGYIKYTNFDGRENNESGSLWQFKNALDNFKRDGKTKLILDLRNNGGGYMDILTKISGCLIKKDGANTKIAVAKDKHQNERSYYLENSCYDNYNFEKIIVLANENTASASEALIGAMLDYDVDNKLTVVLDGHLVNGEVVYKTYGKGIMQTTYEYIDGSAIKITTAEIYFPKSNISIHKKGITTAISTKVVNATNGDALSFALDILNG